jgi:hypothetical protein
MTRIANFLMRGPRLGSNRPGRDGRLRPQGQVIRR